MLARYQVALIAPEYPPDISGGVGIHVREIMASHKIKVQYELFIPQSCATTPEGARLHEIEISKSSSELEAWLQFCRAAIASVEKNNIRPELIHCHDWMTVLAGIRLRHLLKVPLVFNVHLPSHSGYKALLENLGLIIADLVIVNSHEVSRELIARKLPIRRIEVVPNGVDSSLFCLGPSWPKDEEYILFVGRLVAQKGIDVLLRAFSTVLQRCPEMYLVIVGDGELELYLRRLTRYLGIPHRVRFAKWQTGSALVNYYQRAQVVVVPSYYEPFGLVALEAMACGRPVVASRTGGLLEIVEEGVQGHLVPIGDHLQLARQLTGLILDPERRQRMGSLARERALRFSWDSTASRIMHIYEQLLGKPIEPNGGQAIREVSLGFNMGQFGNLGPWIQDLLSFA